MSTNTSTESDSAGEPASPYARDEDSVERGESLGFDRGDDAPSRPDRDHDEPRRDDWWGEPDVRTAANEHHDHGTDWSEEDMHDEKAAYFTRLVMRGILPALCGTSIDDPAKTPTELTEPMVRPHGSGNRTHLRDARINEQEGYISGGESTGVRLGDIPTEDFINAVELLLGYWDAIGKIDADDVSRLMVDAQRMKRDPDKTDEETINALVRDALSIGEKED